MTKHTENLIRAIRVAPGLLVFGLALLTPALRRPDGWLLPMAWTLAVGGISLALIGAAWRTRWQECAGLLALALVGQAAALAMIEAPNYSVIQHYLPWEQLLTSPIGFLLLGPISQTFLILGAASRLRRLVKTWMKPLMSSSQALVLVGVIVVGAAYGSWDITRYIGEVILAVWILTVNAANLILAAAALPGDVLDTITAWIRRRFGSVGGRQGVLPIWDRLFPWTVALWVTAISAALSWAVFERIPHIPDAVSYLFQAKYFSTGHLYLPAPPDSAAFDFEKLYTDGTKWWGYGFPGWPAVLALGVLVGIPWIVNPILGGLTVLLSHALVRRLYNRSVAHGVVLLLAVSPWFLFMSASFMAHPLSVVWLLLALLAIEKARASAHAGWGIVAGTSLGGLALTRPLEAVLLCVVVVLWSLQLGGQRLRGRALAGLATTGFLVGALIFPYNQALTGNVLYTPHEKWTDERWYPGADRLGFGPNVGNFGWLHLDPFPGHGPLDVVVNAHQNFYMSNFELFGWGFGSIGFVGLMFLWGRWSRADWLFIAIVLAIIGGHSFYWFGGGPDLGARYWYQILVPLIVLTIRGIQILQERLTRRGVAKLNTSRMIAFVVLASVIAFINVVPWRSLDKYYRYRGMSSDVKHLAETHQFGQSLVFVQAREKEDYASAFILNPPTLETPGAVYALDAGSRQREVVWQHFPDRAVWVVGRSPAHQDRMQVLAGPLPPPGPGWLSTLPKSSRVERLNSSE